MESTVPDILNQVRRGQGLGWQAPASRQEGPGVDAVTRLDASHLSVLERRSHGGTRQRARRRLRPWVKVALCAIVAAVAGRAIVGWDLLPPFPGDVGFRHPVVRSVLGMQVGGHPRPPLRSDKTLAAALKELGLPNPPVETAVRIRKDERILQFLSRGRLVKEYRVALGITPVGDKTREGDGRTPEGEFYLCTRLPKSRFHRFLGLSYPAPEDAEAGLKQRAINKSQHRAILASHRRRTQPPWNTPLGGAIGIHGGGTEVDWTIGCIALANSDLDELFPILLPGAPVTIEP